MQLKSAVVVELGRLFDHRGWTMEAVAARARELFPGATWTKQGVSKVIRGEVGSYLESLEQIVAAMDGRVAVTILGADETRDPRQDIAHAVLLLTPDQAQELEAVVSAWPHLTDDDRDLFLYRSRRRLAEAGADDSGVRRSG